MAQVTAPFFFTKNTRCTFPHDKSDLVYSAPPFKLIYEIIIDFFMENKDLYHGWTTPEYRP